MREFTSEEKKKIISYQRRRDIALTTILLTIDDACSATVIDQRDPAKIWLELHDMYHAISLASVDTYLSQYQEIKMRPGETVMAYVNRLTEIENKLAAVGQPQIDEEKRRALLRGLTKKFRVPVQVIRALEKGRSEAIGLLVTHDMTSPEILEEHSSTRPSALISSKPHEKNVTTAVGLDISNQIAFTIPKVPPTDLTKGMYTVKDKMETEGIRMSRNTVEDQRERDIETMAQAGLDTSHLLPRIQTFLIDASTKRLRNGTSTQVCLHICATILQY